MRGSGLVGGLEGSGQHKEEEDPGEADLVPGSNPGRPEEDDTAREDTREKDIEAEAESGRDLAGPETGGINAMRKSQHGRTTRHR